jgi:DNA-binding transcriptional MocR family regulator
VHSGLLEQRILDAMLRSGRLTGHLNSIRATYRLKARTMVEALRTMAGNHLAFREPSGGMFVWAQLEGDARQVAGADWLAFGRTHRVLVVPGQAFATDGRPNGYIRLTFANPGVEEIRVGIKRLVAGLNAESTRIAAHAAN